MRNSKFLLTSLLAAATMISVPAYADTPVITWGLNNTTTNVYKWNGTADTAEPSDYDTASNWLKGDTNTTWSDISSITNFATSTSTPARPQNKGVVLYFDGNGRTLNFRGKGLVTSDGGGAWVAGTNNTVTVDIGQWAGSIRVDATNTLNTSWTKLKEGNIVAEGIVNGSGNLQFDGSGLRTWYTGENGQINMLTATGVSNSGSISATGLGTVTFSTLTSIAAGSYVEAAGATVDFNSQTLSGAGSIKLSSGTIKNVTIGSGMTFDVAGTGSLSGTITLGGVVNFLSSSSALDASGATSLSVTSDVVFSLAGLSGVKNDDGSTTFSLISGKTLGTDWTGLNASNLNLVGTGVGSRNQTVSFSENGSVTVSGTLANLVWSGKNSSVWDVSTQNWTNGDADDVFYSNDNVTFNKDATVTVDATGVAAGTVTIASGKTVSFTQGAVHAASFALGSGASLSLDAGSANGATATLADNSRYIVTATTGAFDFSNVSGTGSLVFRPTKSNPGYDGGIKVALSDDFTGEFVLDSNVWLSFAADHSTFGGATIVLSGDALFHSTKTVNLTNDIRLDGTAAIWSDNSNATVTLSGDVTGSSGILDRRGGGAMIFSKSVSVETFNQKEGATRVTGTATLGTASVSGGSLTFEGATTLGTLNVTNGTTNFTGATNITSATVTGGTLKFDFGALNNVATFSSASTLTVNGGTAIFGYDSGEGGTITGDSFGQNLSIVVGSGARMTIAIAQGATAMKAFAGNLTLKNGATYYKFDGGVELAGNVTLGEADSDVVYLLGNWGKLGTKISGSLSGAGTAYFGNNGDSDTTTEVLTISGSDNSYSGEIVVGKRNAGTDSARNTELVLSTATALQNGKVNLAGSAAGNYAQLTLGADAITIAGLSGTEFGKVALGSGVSSSTLTLNQASDTTTFSGTIADGIALKKAGAGTLTLGGNNTYTGGTVIEAGTVVAAHANALGTTKGVEVQSGATLNLGTSAVTVAGLSGAGSVGLADGTDSATLTVNGGGVFTGTLNGGTNSLALVFDADGQTLALNPAVSNTLSSVDVRAGTVKTGSFLGLGYSQVSVQSSGILELTASKTNDYGLALGGITFADGSSFVVDVTGAAENDVLKIITSSVIKFNTGSEDVSLTSDNLDLFVNDFVTLKGWDGLADWSYADNMLSVTLTIPEPSTFGLLAGLGALALAGTRRRRRK